MGAPIYKRKRSFEDSDEEDMEPQNDSKMKKKTSKSSLGLGEKLRNLRFYPITSSVFPGCTCKKGCKTKACSCKKAGNHCVVLCKCDPHTCANR